MLAMPAFNRATAASRSLARQSPDCQAHQLLVPKEQFTCGLEGSADVNRRAVCTDILHFPARLVLTAADHLTSADARNVRGFSERPMIIPVTTVARPQQRYDHRLRDLVQRTRDLTLAADLGVPRSTARGWLDKAPKVVVSPGVTDLTALELQQEMLKLRRRVKKLTALLRLALRAGV